MRFYVRIGCVLAVLGGATLAACGDDDSSANDTLPPIMTTTTTTTMPPTTTTIPEFYIVLPGESLFIIAEKFQLDFNDLAAYNGITNPDKVNAGQKLKIPQPGETTTTTIGLPVISELATSTTP